MLNQWNKSKFSIINQRWQGVWEMYQHRRQTRPPPQPHGEVFHSFRVYFFDFLTRSSVFFEFLTRIFLILHSKSNSPRTKHNNAAPDQPILFPPSNKPITLGCDITGKKFFSLKAKLGSGSFGVVWKLHSFRVWLDVFPTRFECD